MKVLVMSDSHGLIQEVKEIVNHFHADYVVHCGDYCVDEKRQPFSTMIKVRGNCDSYSKVPLQRKLQWNGLHILLVHGHRHKVKESLLALTYFALEQEAHIVLFGHSHLPVCTLEEGVLFINPGSVSKPRGYPEPTFALVEVEKEEQDFQIKVNYYNRSFLPIREFGGNYVIHTF